MAGRDDEICRTVELPRVAFDRFRFQDSAESPMDRLRRRGARSLSDHELLSAVLQLDDWEGSVITLRYQGGQEIVGALYLDSRQRLLDEQEIYRGTLQRAAVEPREPLRQALLCGAASFVIFHTHPSGDPAPSLDDLAFTQRLNDAATVMGIELADHLIIGTGGRWVSLKGRRAY